MDERKGLDYASFEKAVYPYCSDVARIKELFEIKSDSPLMNRDFFDKYVLLAAGLTDEDVDLYIEGGYRSSKGLTSAVLSRYRNGRDRNVHIEKAYLKAGCRERIKQHFEKYLVPTVIENGKYYILYELWHVIKKDESIPDIYRKDFEALNNIETFTDFICEVYLFALTRYESSEVRDILEKERQKQKLHPLIEEIIRDVQIRKDPSKLISTIKMIHSAMDEESPERLMTNLTWYDGAMLWRETHEYINESELDAETIYHYESLKSISFMLEVNEFRERSYSGLSDISVKYGYLDPEKPPQDTMWINAKLKQDDKSDIQSS